MKIVRKSEYPSMPWKNGGGETLEVAVHPLKASVNDFHWRVSIAGVTTNGPFSAFPQVDRTLTLIEGDGIELAVEGSETKALRIGSEPYSFPADLPTHARLLSGPVSDLNVMTRRDLYMHRVRRHVVEGTASITTDADTMLVIGTSSWFAIAPGAEMEPLDLLIVDRGCTLVRSHQKYAVLFTVEIEPVNEQCNSSEFFKIEGEGARQV